MTAVAASPDIQDDSRTRKRVLVRGTVQGVGFRPFVYRQATALGLAGWVANGPEGVTVEIEGDPESIEALVRAIRQAAPANADIASMEIRAIAPRGDLEFTIGESALQGVRHADVLPDLATCDACLAEIRDPTNRRYRYPFTNCTDCGPRYSIIEAVPYDRARTTMREFSMCPACQAEYDDPADRRFHAEPTACPACGPRLALWDGSGTALAAGDDALTAAAAALRGGRIIAVKGIGGFHLFVDARDEAAVRRLRSRKRRPEKPFAVMFPDVDAVRACCAVGPAAEALLTSPARPIVLLRRTSGDVAPSVAPDNARLGTLLPYAPLHHLLLAALGFPVVATSGNVSDEPIVTDEGDALDRLGGIADLFLVHDRSIVRPIDDSVAQIVCGEAQLLRRARGYAPASVSIDGVGAGMLAFGGHLKATVAVTRPGAAVLSQHIGDLDTRAARRAYAAAVADVSRLHDVEGRRVVCDRHPDYASTRAAQASGLPVTAVQHHVAHAAASLAENGIKPPALGVVWDGTGYGPDGTIWGGEFLHLTQSGWNRVAHLRPFRLPGGNLAIREPRRAALGLLHAAYGDSAFAMLDLPPVAAFGPAERDVLRTMCRQAVNAPLTSSIGRLFDAFAALVGLRQKTSYEGQAAGLLEWSADSAKARRRYAFPVCDMDDGRVVLDWRPALEALLADRRAGVGAGAVAAALHDGLARAIVAVAKRAGERRVVLSGGCFQNTRLTEATVAALEAAGFEPVWHRMVPPNDGGIALGQLAWASWMEGADTSCA